MNNLPSEWRTVPRTPTNTATTTLIRNESITPCVCTRTLIKPSQVLEANQTTAHTNVLPTCRTRIAASSTKMKQIERNNACREKKICKLSRPPKAYDRTTHSGMARKVLISLNFDSTLLTSPPPLGLAESNFHHPHPEGFPERSASGVYNNAVDLEAVSQTNWNWNWTVFSPVVVVLSGKTKCQNMRKNFVHIYSLFPCKYLSAELVCQSLLFVEWSNRTTDNGNPFQECQSRRGVFSSSSFQSPISRREFNY